MLWKLSSQLQHGQKLEEVKWATSPLTLQMGNTDTLIPYLKTHEKVKWSSLIEGQGFLIIDVL